MEKLIANVIASERSNLPKVSYSRLMGDCHGPEEHRPS